MRARERRGLWGERGGFTVRGLVREILGFRGLERKRKIEIGGDGF